MNFKADCVYRLSGRTFMRTLAFPTRANYRFFSAKLAALSEHCNILCYCLLPDQFHLIVQLEQGSVALEKTPNGQMQTFCRLFGNVLSSYAQAYNKQQRRRGSLFQPRTRSIRLGSNLARLFDEIHQMPVMAGLVFEASDWEFSSLREYDGLITGFCQTALAAQLLNSGKAP